MAPARNATWPMIQSLDSSPYPFCQNSRKLTTAVGLAAVYCSNAVVALLTAIHVSATGTKTRMFRAIAMRLVMRSNLSPDLYSTAGRISSESREAHASRSWPLSRSAVRAVTRASSSQWLVTAHALISAISSCGDWDFLRVAMGLKVPDFLPINNLRVYSFMLIP